MSVFLLCTDCAEKRSVSGFGIFSGVFPQFFPSFFFLYALLLFKDKGRLYFGCVIHLVNRVINIWSVVNREQFERWMLLLRECCSSGLVDRKASDSAGSVVSGSSGEHFRRVAALLAEEPADL